MNANIERGTQRLAGAIALCLSMATIVVAVLLVDQTLVLVR